MNLGIVIYSADAETIWNALRLGVVALTHGDRVRVFLLAKGVESEALHSEQFPIKTQMQAFADAGGSLLACGTCLKLRHAEGTELCPASTMQDLYELIQSSDKVVSF